MTFITICAAIISGGMEFIMNEELTYIKELSNEELANIISNIWGFEETAEALLQLSERIPSKALELGIDILENDKGDDYLQASVWDMIFDIDPVIVMESLIKRDRILGKTLFHDVLGDLNTEYYIKDLKKISLEFVNKIIQSYNSLDKDAKIELSEAFNEFNEKINK